MGAPPSIAEAIDLAAITLIRIWHDPRMEPEKPTMAVLSCRLGDGSPEFGNSMALMSKPNITLKISVTVASARSRFSVERKSPTQYDFSFVVDSDILVFLVKTVFQVQASLDCCGVDVPAGDAGDDQSFT
jgi:hypothetical protein